MNVENRWRKRNERKEKEKPPNFRDQPGGGVH